jgi:hypothetical protein
MVRKIFKTALLLLFLLFFVSCDNGLSTIENKKYFQPDRLSILSLDNICDFWKDDTIKSVEHPLHGIWSSNPGFLDGYRYFSNKGKILAVSVFKTQEIAIDAMEERIKNVSAIIFPGDSYGDWDKETYEAFRDQYWSADTQKRLKDRWWWSIYIFGNAQRGIYLNKWNTIIEAGNLNDDLSDSSRILLEDAAIKIANRVEALSNDFPEYR